MGELDFEDAVSIYAEVINAGKAQADAVIIETMSDTYEMKAALLAAKENCNLPVFASFIFDQSGRLLTGADVKTAAVLAESLGADVIGINCGFGPAQFLELVKELRRYSSLPILAQPNAGLPESINGKTVYNLSVEEYAAAMQKIAALGVNYLGGCCGTTPAHIKTMIQTCREIPAGDTEQKSFLHMPKRSHSVKRLLSLANASIPPAKNDLNKHWRSTIFLISLKKQPHKCKQVPMCSISMSACRKLMKAPCCAKRSALCKA